MVCHWEIAWYTIGMETTKNITIDRLGRVVVPKAVRDQAGLVPGMPLSIRYSDGRVEIEPAPVRVKIVKRGKLHVAVPLDDVPPLADEIVRRTQAALREERG